MVEPSAKRPRITPRNSAADELLAQQENETPYTHLKALANVESKRTMATPAHHSTPHQLSTTPSFTPAPLASVGRAVHRTPVTARPISQHGSARRPLSVKRTAPPTTPHAIRALQQRRNAVLASGGRRRSGVGQGTRWTPRDTLRALSRKLATVATERLTSPETPPESASRPRNAALDSFDEGPALPQQPRISLPLNDLEDDSFHERPPRLSVLPDDDENLTTRSLEAGRRATSEEPRGRSAGQRRSIPGFRLSEDFGDLSGLDHTSLSEGGEPTRTVRLSGDDIADLLLDDNGEQLRDEDTRELRAALEEARRRSGANGDEDGETGRMVLDVEEDTFKFTVPNRRRSELLQPEVLEDKEENENDDQPVLEEGSWEDEPASAETADAVQAEEQQQQQQQLSRHAEDDSELSSLYERLHDSQAAAALSTQTAAPTRAKSSSSRNPRQLRKSRHGIPYTPLPTSLIRKLSTTSFRRVSGSKSRLSADSIAAIERASELYFSQLGDDLSTVVDEAGRKTIDEGDVLALMHKQRLLGDKATVFSLGQKYLSRELVGELRVVPSTGNMGRKRKRLETIEEEEEDE